MKLPFKMTNRIRAGLTVACLVAAWLLATPSETWHYRMTVTLQTPDGAKSGSAVRAVTIHPGLGFTGLPPSFDLDGEAVAIETAPGKFVFALLRSNARDREYAAEIFAEAFPQDKKSGSVTLTDAQYPMFVHFDDLQTPKSAARDDTAVKSVTIEVTDAPVSWSLAKMLPWLHNYAYQRLDGERFLDEKSKTPFANSIAAADFSSDPGRE